MKLPNSTGYVVYIARIVMVYIQTSLGDAEHVFRVSGDCIGHSNADRVHAYLKYATFLFNIKDKL